MRHSLVNHIPRWLLVLLVFLATVSVVPAERNDDLDTPFITDAPDSPIIVGGDYNYPPYEFVNEDGQPAGFNVELTRAIADVMGMDIEIRLGPWSEMRKGLASGEIDALQGMAWTRERTQEVEYSTPHAKVHQSIWIRKGSSIDSLEDLNSKNVIVMRGAVMHDFMLQRPELKARLHPVETLEDALRQLSEGQYDAALVAKLPGEYLVQKTGLDNITPIAKPLVAQDYGYAVSKGNLNQLAAINEGLVLLKKSGRYRLIYEKWLGVLPQPGISTEKIVRIGAMVVLPLLLVLATTVFWSRTLSRQVALRTEALELEVASKEKALHELEVQQKQLIQADKLSSLGILTSGVAHEINNPVGLILLNLPHLKASWDDIAPILQKHAQQHGDYKIGWFNYARMSQEIPQMLDEMQQGAERIKGIVEDLKNFTRRDNAEFSVDVDLNQVADMAIRLVDNSLKKATNNFQLDLTEGLPEFRGNAQRIEQVVINLLLNACQALSDREQSIKLRTALTEEGGLLLEVKDQGCGISSENLQKLTDPFFTTKRDIGGTGLGLSISEKIVLEHGGSLRFNSELGKETRISMLLPVKGEKYEG